MKETFGGKIIATTNAIYWNELTWIWYEVVKYLNAEIYSVNLYWITN